MLEANFVEPAHDKQGFERTVVLSRLEAKLVGIQKDYWFVLHITCVEITCTRGKTSCSLVLHPLIYFYAFYILLTMLFI